MDVLLEVEVREGHEFEALIANLGCDQMWPTVVIHDVTEARLGREG